MTVLDRKILRDLRRLWSQALAIALVMAAGVATLILAVGAYQSLEETRAAYYERHSFADVFAELTRAPDHLTQRIERIDGVVAVETRISESAILDVLGFEPPVTGLVLSLPDHRMPRLNRPYLRMGRFPDAGSPSEATVNEAFANAHGLTIGSTFSAILNGRKRKLTIVGLVLSPEFIYAIGPGDLVPDNRRFAVIWMSRSALEDIFDLEGAFNAVALKLSHGASERSVIEQLDNMLERYGGSGATGREDQLSHAFLDAELKQLRALARIIPPIFLFVSAFLINMTLTRLIALEREQIGLLKALGYEKVPIALHYMKLVAVIALVGIIIGIALGTRFGEGLTRLYSEFFNFPFLVFARDPAIYLLSAAVCLAAAAAGAARAVFAVVRLDPVVAMKPPAPPRYRRTWSERHALFRHLSQMTVISIRHIIRWPVRAAFTTLGVALACALLVVSLFSFDSIEHMIDVSFFIAQRQDASLTLAERSDQRVMQSIANLPGVMRAEPFRSVPVRMRNGQHEKLLSIQGKPRRPALSRVIDLDLNPVSLPEEGLVIDERVAQVLHLRRGDFVEVEFLDGRKRAPRMMAQMDRGDAENMQLPTSRVYVPIADVIRSYFGLSAFMEISALGRLRGEGPVVNGAFVQYDRNRQTEFFAAIKDTPEMAGIGLRSVSLSKFRETLEKNIDMMVTIYAALAIIVAVGVVYNSARIQLSEQARELASLRVLGFTRAEVSRVLVLELAILVILAQPLGWVLGYAFSWLTIQGFSSDLYRAPLIINLATYAWSSVVVGSAAILAALLVRRRIDKLDLIAVLKTRE